MGDRVVGFILLFLLWPVMALLALMVGIFSGWPVFFCQNRIGYKGKVFRIIKFRTMKEGAEKLKEEIKNLNEADGPVFKIKNDPRLTDIGRLLFHSGLDEMPQFINMLKGEMSLVGPRPLPVDEEEKIETKYRFLRQSVKPGIVSPWILEGYHRMKFKDWMKSDLIYIENKTFINDLKIVFRSGVLVMKLFFGEFCSQFRNNSEK